MTHLYVLYFPTKNYVLLCKFYVAEKTCVNNATFKTLCVRFQVMEASIFTILKSPNIQHKEK